MEVLTHDFLLFAEKAVRAVVSRHRSFLNFGTLALGAERRLDFGVKCLKALVANLGLDVLSFEALPVVGTDHSSGCVRKLSLNECEMFSAFEVYTFFVGGSASSGASALLVVSVAVLVDFVFHDSSPFHFYIVYSSSFKSL